MIERYSCAISDSKLKQLLSVSKLKTSLKKQYNISPLNKAPILHEKEGKIVVEKFIWGLLPHTAASSKNKGNLYNALIERLPSSSSFRLPYRQQRCLIPADGYYIFQRVNSSIVPYRVSPKNGDALFFAGIYDYHRSEIGLQKTFSIITAPREEGEMGYGSRVPFCFNSLQSGVEWTRERDVNKSYQLLSRPERGSLNFYRIFDYAKNKEYNGPRMHEECHRELTLFDV